MDVIDSQNLIGIVRQPAKIKRLSMPIVLLHGWGCDSRIWQPLLPLLRDWADVITVDIRYAETAVDALVDAIVAGLPEHFILCGWSLGGMLATRVAVNFSDRVFGLITLSTNLSFVEKPFWRSALASATFEQFYTLFDNNPDKGLQRFLLLEVHGDQSARQQLQWLQQLQRESALDPQCLLSGLQLLAEIDNTHNVPQIVCPALYVFGEHDALVPVKVVTVIEAKLNQHQQCLILTDKGHVLHYPLNAIECYLNAFLAKLSVIDDPTLRLPQ